jgi:hypothetical protein
MQSTDEGILEKAAHDLRAKLTMDHRAALSCAYIAIGTRASGDRWRLWEAARVLGPDNAIGQANLAGAWTAVFLAFTALISGDPDAPELTKLATEAVATAR